MSNQPPSSYGVSIDKLMADYKTLLSYMKTIANNPLQKTDAHLAVMARDCLRELDHVNSEGCSGICNFCGEFSSELELLKYGAACPACSPNCLQ